MTGVFLFFFHYSDGSDVLASTSETAAQLTANGAAVAIAASTSKEVGNGDKLVLENVEKIGDNNCECEEDKALDKSYHNASTLVLGEKNKKSNAGSDVSTDVI